jgi:hypothetical protein
MAASAGPTSKLCQWINSTRYEAIPEEVRKETVILLYDQVGCMIASVPFLLASLWWTWCESWAGLKSVALWATQSELQ